MKLTKYDYACFTVKKDDQVLVVDPGNFSDDFIAPHHVAAVVVTHQHADHFDKERLAEIFAKNDDVLILGPADVIDKVEIENKRVVSTGETVVVGAFTLEFFGGVHALIHSSIPRLQNLGVMINDLIYYPGDSLDIPNKPVDVLAITAAAPWLKIGEAMDFLTAIHPRLAFPTHDAVASNKGRELADQMLSGVAQSVDTEYKRLDSPIDV